MNTTCVEDVVLKDILTIGVTHPELTALDAIVKFVFTECPNNTSKTLMLDFARGAQHNIFDNEQVEPALTVTVTYENMHALSRGKLDSRMAYMEGKVILDGDLDIAIKLENLLDHYIGHYSEKCT